MGKEYSNADPVVLPRSPRPDDVVIEVEEEVEDNDLIEPQVYLHVSIKVNLAALLSSEGVGDYLAEYFRDDTEIEAANLEVRSVGIAILE